MPIALSLVVIAAWILGIALFGVPAREPDEGVAAHLFQIWLVLEALMMAFFAFTWLPRRPMEAFVILALQVAAVLAGCAPVFFFRL